MSPRYKIVLLFLCSLLFATQVHAVDESEGNEAGKGGSGLPIPRFASLKASDVNLRTGPGTRYPIEWVFTHRGMPVEITAEYDAWRRIRDADGDEGWVHKNGLTGIRSAIVTGAGRELRQNTDNQGQITAHLEAGAIGQLVACSKDWCKLRFEGTRGYLKKGEFWGAYAAEVFD